MDVLEAKQDCKEDASEKHGRLLPGVNQRQNQEPVHEAVVLKMDVVNDKECWG